MSAYIPDTSGYLWVDDAACAALDLPVEAKNALFFVAAGQTITDEALALCRSCPVRIDCLRHAYERDLASGYFGGLSVGQRRELGSFEAAVEFIQNEEIDDTAATAI